MITPLHEIFYDDSHDRLQEQIRKVNEEIDRLTASLQRFTRVNLNTTSTFLTGSWTTSGDWEYVDPSARNR